jgi:hypothetical protein
MSKGQVKILSDMLIIEALLADPKMRKNASVLTDLEGFVKNWISSKIDKDNPVESAVNLLTPGVVLLIFKSFGWGRLGFIIAALLDAFDFNPYEMLEPLCAEALSKIKSGEQTTSSQVMSLADSIAQQVSSSSGQPADDGKDLLRHARMINLALIDFEHQNLRLLKNGFDSSQSNLYKMAALPGLKAKDANLLGKIFGFIVVIILGSLGALVVGDIMRGLVGKPPSHQVSGPGSLSPAPTMHVATQTKYPFKSNSPLPASVNGDNSKQNIENIIMQFTKDVYSGLDGKESLIMNNPKFQYIVEEISWLNRAKGYSAVFMPTVWSTKKEMVDSFIDDVAASDK